MSRSPTRVLAVVVGVLVVLAAAAAVLSSRGTTHYAAGSPEATVQAYLTAVLRGDTEQAAGYLSPSGSCDQVDLAGVTVADSTRVDLVHATTGTDTAQVQVTVDRSDTDGPFAVGESEGHVYRLARTGGRWLLEGVPWPLYDCTGGPK
ncbi:hypothetical protein [Phycicoccus sp. 3266]|uniref:hypothetical protein n=1 Tax=Phycicoccus sp. 3266 TaxID=2817751 RepID=UPI002862DEA1|nr:hypothetical protein [Phycicoccus sp. 3266]MDR6865310.1 hypothetical protein [Phycicoccus sp. 3266]